MDRRSFIKGGAIMVGAAAALGGMAACSPHSQDSPVQSGIQDNLVPEGLSIDFYEESCALLEPVTEFADEKTYDIVVVGAGVSGVPAVLTAVQEGVSVCCLQKEPTVAANGSGSKGIILDETTDEGLASWKDMFRETTSNRCDPALLDFYVQHSGETVRWMAKCALEIGFDFRVSNSRIDLGDNRSIVTISNVFDNNAFLTQVAQHAESMGAEFFYSTPAVQLVKDESGRVCGVVGQAEDGSFIKFNATKGVVIAAGDYENNESMKRRYKDDALDFRFVQTNRTGDGILMAAAAGGHIVPGPHPAQLHDMHTSPMPLQGLESLPFFAVNMRGERFMNEEIAMDGWWLMLRFQKTDGYIGNFCRIFDSNYGATMEEWGAMMGVPSPEDLEPYMPENSQYNGNGGIYCADTLEELAEKLGIPADTFIASVERYNELCESGSDPDFGKESRYLAPIVQPPFWGILNDITCCAIDAGIAVDGNYQVIDSEGNPIEGLFSVGSGAGCLCGDINWPLEYTGSISQYYGRGIYGGLSNGHCMTAGRYATLYAITGGFEPQEPVPWNDAVHAFYFDGAQDNPWA